MGMEAGEEGDYFSLSLSLSLSLWEFSAPGYQRAATNLELHNFIPYFVFLS